MKITQLVAKPKLIKIEVSDEDTLKEFGEPIEFWMYDRQPMSRFVKLATLKEENFAELVDEIQDLVLDEQGQPVLKDDNILPVGVMTRVVGKVVETLGK